MTAKTMQEVLERHGEWRYTNGAGSPIVCRECGAPVDSVTEHQAAAITAAGYGLVADAKREALEEAADSLEGPDSYSNAYSKGVGLWLRARAAEMRQG